MIPEEIMKKQNRIWNAINTDSNSIKYFDKYFTSSVNDLLVLLISSLFEDEEFDIGTFYRGNSEGAIITYDIYSGFEKMLNLELTKKNGYELILTLDNEDGKQHHYKKLLEDADLKVIPKGLDTLMRDVLLTMEECRVNPKSIKV